MKKIIVLIVCFIAGLCGVSELAAQENNWWIGGEVSYWHNKDTDGLKKTNKIDILPTIGYKFSESLGAGLKVGYSYEQKKPYGGDEDNFHAFVINPFARWFFFNQSNFHAFLDLGVGVAMGNNHGWEIGITPGIEYMPIPKVGIFATYGFLGYRERYFNGSTYKKSKGFGLLYDATDLTVGINYHF